MIEWPRDSIDHYKKRIRKEPDVAGAFIWALQKDVSDPDGWGMSPAFCAINELLGVSEGEIDYYTVDEDEIVAKLESVIG